MLVNITVNENLPLNKWDDSRATFSKQIGPAVRFCICASRYTSSDFNKYYHEIAKVTHTQIRTLNI